MYYMHAWTYFTHIYSWHITGAAASIQWFSNATITFRGIQPRYNQYYGARIVLYRQN